MKLKTLLTVFYLSILSFAQANKPIISFFNEMKGPALKELLKDTTIIPTLVAMNAQIRMGILDLTPERAEVLKKLNQAKIPVVAWLLLPEEKGYWFHSGNGEMAIERYKEIKKWADAEGIVFNGIGLDLELDMNDMIQFKKDKWGLIRKLPARLFDKEQIANGHKIYNQLLELIKQDGYPIESYYASFIKDETANGTTSIQQLTKFLDVKTDKEIPMLYTSFMGNAYGMLKVFAIDQKLKYAALGSTGGGVDTSLPTLSWEDLARDMRLAAQTAEEIHIFSLEGTIQKGFLKNLVNFDYSLPVEAKPAEVENIKSFQSKFVMVSNILSHPTMLFVSLILIFGLLLWLIYRLVRFLYFRYFRKLV